MEIKEVEDQFTLAVRLICRPEQLPEIMVAVYAEISDMMQQRTIPFAGPPFALYHNMDIENFDVEIGFPVSESFEGEGRVLPGLIPGGRVVSILHTGPYAELEKTYDIAISYIREKGIGIDSWMYERYLNSPEDSTVDNLKTEIFFPII
jgi:effector-binding domain-containing protein